MKLRKALNNNVALVLDKDGREAVIMGSGVAYNLKPGAKIDLSRVEKRFVLDGKTGRKDFDSLLRRITVKDIELASEIIHRGEQKLGYRCNDSILLTLSDHLGLMLERAKAGISGLLFREGEDRKEIVYQAAHYEFVAGALAVKKGHEINSEFKIGCMLAALPYYPYSSRPEDMLLAQHEDRKSLFFTDVQIRGHYPAYILKEWERERYRFDITDEDLQILKEGRVDYLGFSYYYTNTVTTDESVAVTGDRIAGSGNEVENPYLPATPWGWTIDPKGLRYTLNQYYDRYEIPLFVVENGFGYEDVIEDGQIHDANRIHYLREHIREMKKAVEEDGVDVLGYTVWGCIDPVSFTTGEMRKRYGFIYVDKKDDGSGTYQRIPKDSFYWYKRVIASNGEELE